MPETAINKIAVSIATGNVEDAGTDGHVYLGVCGREFYADTTSDDYERGSHRTYIFGEGANVSHPQHNDPREHFLIIENVEFFPTYLRFQPESRTDDWFMERASMTFNDEPHPVWDSAGAIGGRGIWLGTRTGMYIHLPLT